MFLLDSPSTVAYEEVSNPYSGLIVHDLMVRIEIYLHMVSLRLSLLLEITLLM